MRLPSCRCTCGEATSLLLDLLGIGSVLESGMVQCSLFLLFTSQRSGSTWTCQTLDAQPYVACGASNSRKQATWKSTGTTAEMMILYSHGPLLKSRNMTHAEVSWDVWVNDANRAFQLLQKENCQGILTRRAVGFKLMHDQVPEHLISNFLEYVAQHNITVLHLVREAVILRLASHAQTSVSQSNNASFVATLRYQKWNPKDPSLVVDQIKRTESVNAAWRRLLLFNPLIKYHYVSYEQLTGPWKQMYLEELIRFTGVEANAAALVPHELVQLHEGTCSERVHEYANFATLLGETQTTAACAMLEGRPVGHSPTLSRNKGVAWLERGGRVTTAGPRKSHPLLPPYSKP